MNKILFSDGSKVSSAKVTIDEVDYPVTPARYNGATPLSSTILNTMQDNIEDAINQNADNIGGEEYDNTSTYAVGDIVKYNRQLYICNTDIVTPEEFDNTKWDETDVLSSAGGNEIAIGSASDITGKTKIFIDESTQALKYKDSTTGQFTDIAGDEVFIGDEQDAPEDTKIIIDDEGQPLFSSEVVNSLSGNETAKAPSVKAVNDRFTYSTEEQVIGTWIDGKPLYRKVISFENSTAIYSGSTISTGVTNIDTLRKIDFEVSSSSKTAMYNVPYYRNSNSNINYNLVLATGIIELTTGSDFSSGTSRKINITMEYTKTTD